MADFVLKTEENLVGQLEEELAISGTSVRASFYSKNNRNEQRVPVAPLRLTLARNSAEQEQILVSAVGTPDSSGIVELTISARQLGKNLADMSSKGDGYRHITGTSIEGVDGHFVGAVLEGFLNGAIATKSGVKLVKETNGDSTVYFEGLKEAPHPFIKILASGGMVYSENGVDSTPFGTGAGMTSGDGISVISGVIATVLQSGTPLKFSDGKIDLNYTDTPDVTPANDAGKLVQLGDGGLVDYGFLPLADLADFVDTNFSDNWDSTKNLLPIVPSNDIVVAQSLAAVVKTATVWEKSKDIEVAAAGTYRVMVDLYAPSGYTVNYRLYKNDVYTGTEWSISPGTTTKIFDLSLSAGDNVQIFVAPSVTTSVSNFKILGQRIVAIPTGTVVL